MAPPLRWGLCVPRTSCYLRADGRARPEVLVFVAEARDRAVLFALPRVPPAFFTLGRARFVPTVRLPGVFFEAVRLFLEALVDWDTDERTEALRLEGDRDERAGALPPEGAPFEFAIRISRTSSTPVATAPRIMPARSSCLTAVRTLPMAPGRAAMFRRKAPFGRLVRKPPAPGNFDEAATITVIGPTLTALARVPIRLPFRARGPFHEGITALTPRARARAQLT